MDQTAHATPEIPVSEGNVSCGSAPLSGSSEVVPEIVLDDGTYRVVKIGGGPLSFDPSVYEKCAQKHMNTIRMKIKEEFGIDLSLPPQDDDFFSNRTWMLRNQRKNLKYHEERFKRQYSYGSTAYKSTSPYTDMMETRHCLTSLSNHAFSWTEKSSGIMWVGVCGIDAMCVVTLSGHLDWNRVNGGLASTNLKTVLSLFRTCVLSELEDLADPSSERCKNWFHPSFDMPFCVVSSTPGTTETPNESGYETSSVGYATEAIDFVRNSGLLPMVQYSDESIRLAILAFQHLIHKKCEAKEIEVTVLSGRSHGIPSIKDLDISEIGDNLATIQKSGFRIHPEAHQSTSETMV